MKRKQILIIYYSYSAQTRKLIQAFSSGLEEAKSEVFVLQIKPVEKLQFPLGSVRSAAKMMVETFFRKRIAIAPLDEIGSVNWDLIVLAGPTWSYNPSGPILSFFDCASDIFSEKKVLPLISCRGYWRTHHWQLSRMLTKSGAEVVNPIVFLHTGPEPWRTIGVFLKMAGKIPESGRSWISQYYTKFGHTKEQTLYARELGKQTSQLLQNDAPPSSFPRIIVQDIT